MEFSSITTHTHTATLPASTRHTQLQLNGSATHRLCASGSHNLQQKTVRLMPLDGIKKARVARKATLEEVTRDLARRAMLAQVTQPAPRASPTPKQPNQHPCIPHPTSPSDLSTHTRSHMSTRGLQVQRGQFCRCKKQCNQTCKEMLHTIAAELLPVANASKCEADVLLCSFLEPNQESGKTTYRFCGQHVCLDALLKCLGISYRRARRIQSGDVDLRFGRRCIGDPRTRSRSAYTAIFGFLWHGAQHMQRRVALLLVRGPWIARSTVGCVCIVCALTKCLPSVRFCR